MLAVEGPPSPFKSSSVSFAITRQTILQEGVFFKKNKGIAVQQLQKSLGAMLPNAISLRHWESPGVELPLICNDGGYDG